MSGDRIVLVGVAWTLFLIGLLVLREFVRAADAPSWRPLLPFINVLVVVMLGAAGLAAGLQLATLTNPATAARPSATAVAIGATPSPAGSPGTPTPSLSGETPTPAPPSSSAPPPPTPTAPPVSPTVAPTDPPATSPPPTPSPTPSPTPQPTPLPTPLPPTPQPPTPPPATATVPPAEGDTVSAGPEFRAFEVDGSRVTGFQTLRADERFTADSSAVETYSFPSLSDPDGTVDLVRVESGDFAGIYVSPDDPGVDFEPAG